MARPLTAGVNPREAERIRGPNLRILANSVPREDLREGLREGLSLQSLVKSANKEKSVLAACKRIIKAFVEPDGWKKLGHPDPGFICRSGTIIAYVEPGVAFRYSKHYDSKNSAVQYIDPLTLQRYLFPIPNGFKMKKDVVLIAQHPDFDLVPYRGNLFIEAPKVFCLDKFPGKSGLYIGDEQFDIPIGESIAMLDGTGRIEVSAFNKKNARFLLRIESWVGAVAIHRDCGIFVQCKHAPSAPMGGLVEAPAERTSRPDTTIGIRGITPTEVKTVLRRFSDELGRVNWVKKHKGRQNFLDSARRLMEVLGGAEIED